MQREHQPESSSGAAVPSRIRRERPFAVTHADIWKITAPMTVAFLTTPLLGLTATAVIGRIGDAVALGGLAVGAIIFDFAFSTFNFLRSGTTGLTAQAVGEDDAREVQAVFWRALVIAVVVGAAMILAEPAITALGLLAVAPGDAVAEVTRTYIFVRMFSAPFALTNYAVLGHVLGRGRGTLGLALQAIINGTNIVLCILFAMVLHWGVAGVALGTVCGEAVGMVVGMVMVVARFDAAHRPSRREVFDRTGFLRMVAVNRDIMIRSFCLLGAFMLFARSGAQLGAVLLAANGILMNLFMLGGFFLDGMATAAEQLVGRSIGAFWRPAFDRAVKLTILWSTFLSLVMTAAFFLGGAAIVDFLTTDAAVRESARTFLPWAALTPLAGSLAFVMDGIYIGATWSRTMRNMMMLSFVVFAAATFVLMPILGNHGLWLALELFLGFRGVSLAASLPRRRLQVFGTA